MKQALIKWLKMPQADTITDLDAPSALAVHHGIIRNKAFLNKVYRNFYLKFKRRLEPQADFKNVVELGSGSGFIKELIPGVITSDILQVPTVDLHFSAERIPLRSASVDAFLMIDVFHHVKKPRLFLDEMQRALRPGGKIVMIEPANSAWGRFVWVNFHHEQFDLRGGWEVAGTGPMSDANGAMPWIVFCRDRETFEKEYPQLSLAKIATHTPFQYLISGGLSIRQLLPGWLYPLVRAIEILLTPLNHFLGMFYLIEIEKRVTS